mmetsp:Transcript_59824/g.125017  ORF Transcript_59824/g.125017 Transcript_59824/m.125017 type:complete len:613 (-) Transcript_59824:1625-3463(-)
MSAGSLCFPHTFFDVSSMNVATPSGESIVSEGEGRFPDEKITSSNLANMSCTRSAQNTNEPVLDYIKRLGDAQDVLWAHVTEMKKQWQRDREDRKRDQRATQNRQDEILAMLRSVGKIQFKTSKDEAEEQRRQHLTQLKELLREGAEMVKTSQEGGQKSSPIMKFLFGIAPADFETGDMGSRAIHPSSRFSTFRIGVTAALLLYTGSVTPVQISFFPASDPCVFFSTLPFDVFVDCYFLLDVITNFFVGYFDDHGFYIDRFGSIATSYVSSPWSFWFDLITSIPISLVDLATYLDCHDSDGPVALEYSSADLNTSRLIRTMKILRFFKLFRLLKLFKFLSIIDDYIAIFFGSTLLRTGKLLFVVLIIVHVFTCVYWLIKTTFANPDSSEIEDFLSARQLDETKTAEIYLCCLYFVFTVFSTVGFGDISAVNSPERAYCIFLFITGASVFGLLISHFNETWEAESRAHREMEDVMEPYLAVRPMLNFTTSMEIRAWVRFYCEAERQYMQTRTVLESAHLPNKLRLEIALNVGEHLFSKVPFVHCGAGGSGRSRTLLAAELLMRSKARYFPRGSILAESRNPANGLMVITAGKVKRAMVLAGLHRHFRPLPPIL